ncbi:MAG: hypothetical protein LBQ15_02455 [Clostridium sp.]|jgi:hypothetical protein|nr:hypothetical protein [Clostridium sp.]
MEKSKIESLLPNYPCNYDQYESLFKTIIHIAKTFSKKGCLIEFIKNDDIKTNFESTKTLIVYVVYLICDARDPDVMSTIVELEVSKMLHKADLTESEIEELILAKRLLYFLHESNHFAIYQIITILCSNTLCNKLLPNGCNCKRFVKGDCPSF